MQFKGTKEKLHAVTYAGIVFIQDTEFYEDSEKCNVLDADHVGLVQAEANGLLFSRSNDLLVSLNISNAILKKLYKQGGLDLLTRATILSQTESNDFLIKQATEL